MSPLFKIVSALTAAAAFAVPSIASAHPRYVAPRHHVIEHREHWAAPRYHVEHRGWVAPRHVEHRGWVAPRGYRR